MNKYGKLTLGSLFVSISFTCTSIKVCKFYLFLFRVLQV